MPTSIHLSSPIPGRVFFDGATHADFDMQIDSAIATEDDRLAPLADFWHRFVWRGALPRRADFHPGDFRSLLGNFLLLDQLADREKTRFRLVGTALTGILRRDATGRRIIDTYEPMLAEQMLRNIDFVVTTRSPVRVLTTLRTDAGGLCRGEALLIPLFEFAGPRAPVGMVLGAATWSRFGRSGEALHGSALRPWDQSLLADETRLH